MSDSTSKPWKGWSRDDWNRVLFEHFFLDVDGTDDHRVSCLPISKERLAQVVEADNGDADEVQDAFISAMGRDGAALERELKRSYWVRKIQELLSLLEPIPPFFAPLALTCLAACGDENIRDDGDFRRRLGKLVGTEHKFRLDELAMLWDLLENWIEIMRNARKPYRRIALPDPRHRTIIGHSIELSFPSIAEQKILDELLSSYKGDFPPPYRQVIEILDPKAGSFKDRFRTMYSDFKRSLDQGDDSSSLHPFWVAVTSSKPSATASKDDPEYVLVLHRHIDRYNAIHLYSDQPIPDALVSIPGRRVVFRKEETTSGEYVYRAICEDPPDSGLPSFMESMMEGTILKKLPGKRTYSLARSIVDGVVLFLQNEFDVFESVTRIPDEGRVVVFANKGLVDALLRCFPVGKKPAFEDAIYSGWAESAVFDASWFSGFDNKASEDVKDIVCLMPRLTPAVISLSGGIKIGKSDYLGISPLLPVARFRSAETMVFHIVLDGKEVEQQMTPHPDEPGAFCFTVPSGESLEGKVLLIAKRSDKTLKRRTVEFRTDVFLGPKAIKSIPDSSLVFQYSEGSGPFDTIVPDRNFIEFGVDSSHLVPHGAVPRRSVDIGAESRPVNIDHPGELLTFEPSGKAWLLADILYALSARRTGINETDLRDIFREALGISGSFLLWDLIRSWIENCLLNRISSGRWRGSTYFAIRPHIALLPSSTHPKAVLRGLASSPIRKAVEAEMNKVGARRIRRFAPCDLIPVPDTWEADSTTSFEIVAEAIGTNFLTLAVPVVTPLLDMSVLSPPAPIRHETYLKWDWDKEVYVDPDDVQEQGSTEIAWQRREDSPDHFRVSKDGEEVFWTRSRTWALLIGYALDGRKVFSVRDRSTLTRSLKWGINIPLVYARHLSATSPIVPGPVVGNEMAKYSYAFSADGEAEKFMDMFWGRKAADVRLLKSLSGWMLAEAARAARQKESTILLPEPYRSKLKGLADFPQGTVLSLARYPKGSIPTMVCRLGKAGLGA